MDILDIDEMLKDDSFHFLEEKNPDDVSNIIQQWKNQNSMQQQQLQQNDLQQQKVNHRTKEKRFWQQQLPDDTFELDSRTFTRPKRRSAVQKLETQFHSTGTGLDCQDQQVTTPVLNVQIGGQVRTPISSRTMLLDAISPPSSICSMDTPVDNFNMDNSLITSADFTHLSFLLSTSSLEGNADLNDQNCAGYTLNDMIRDRKALESLTLSADATLIKDSQISQIDDISLSLLRSSSGCNSMANSAESEEGNHFGLNTNFNDQCEMRTLGNTDSKNIRNTTLTGNNGNATTIVNNNNGSGDATFTCLANDEYFIISGKPEKDVPINSSGSSSYIKQMVNNTTFDQQAKSLGSYPMEKGIDDIVNMKLKTTEMNETVCLYKTNDPKMVPETSTTPKTATNETYDCHQLQGALNETLHTPENGDIDIKCLKVCESTPQTHHMRYGSKNPYAVRKIIEDPNLSPIISMDSHQQDQLHTPKKSDQATDNYFGSPISHITGLDLLENIENPNKTFNRRHYVCQKDLEDQREQHQRSIIEHQDIMDLAQAEAELLDTANGPEDDEQQFEHMLDELGKIKLNPEQLKMQKSLEKIKKRFNCTINQNEQDANAHPQTSGSSSEYGSGLSNTFTSETRQETLRKLRDTLKHDAMSNMSGTSSNSNNPGLNSSGSVLGNSSSFVVSSMGKSNISSGERLLNRRSRLNDDVNLNLTSVKQLSLSHENGTNSSFTMPTKDIIASNIESSSIEKDTTETNAKTENDDVAKYKLPEQRERDRDRFKTIKIVRNKNDDYDSATQTVLNVPCIDDDHNENVVTQLENKGNIDSLPLKNDNESYQNEMKAGTFQKRSSRSDLENSDKVKNSNVASAVSGLRQPESRSLSRPRYISGLQKFSVVSKAASANDLETNENTATVSETKTSQQSRMYDAKKGNIPGSNSNTIAKPTKKLKSPMGTKAKSLHNLAYNNHGSTTAAGAIGQTRIGTFGLRKINSGGFGLDQQRTQKQSQPKPQLQPTASQLKPKSSDGLKKPLPVSGLQSSTTREKGPNLTSRSTAGIARPSSAYYSLNVIPKTDSLPSVPNQFSDVVIPSVNAAGNTTTTGSTTTSIPKPSGIRPPNKRSGLPRPASMIRR